MIIRTNKTKNYTVMSNYHLRDKNLSLKAKGILSLILSLPDDWDYSINGLVSIVKENETCVNSALKELKENGYLIVTKLMPNQTQSGRIEYIYDVFENPEQASKKQDLENLPLEIQCIENQGQLNNNKLNKDNKNNNIIISKEQKHKYGEYQNVLLTDKQLHKLDEDYGEEQTKKAITYLDEYIQMKGYKCKEHNLALRKWVFDAIAEKDQKKSINNMTVKETGLSFSEILRRL